MTITDSSPSNRDEWTGKYAFALKTDEDRKIFLDLVERAYRTGCPDSFFSLLLCMLLAQQAEIESLIGKTPIESV